MLLRNVVSKVEAGGHAVAFVDIETLREIPYPDVLIRLMIELIGALRVELQRRKRFKTMAVRRGLKHQGQRLRELLKDPQETTHSLRESRIQGYRRGGGAGAKGALGVAKPGVGNATASATASIEASRETSTQADRTAHYTRSKMEGLQSEAIEFRETLSKAMRRLDGAQAFIVLDDFYFIERDHQADVLSYLHQITKNQGIWLKVGAVRYRLREFVEGDPPKGIQINHDAGLIEVDTTLADFANTQGFLEEILQDICTEAGVDPDDLVTPTGKNRLVLASGGAPRDYVNVVLAALRHSQRRPPGSGRAPNRINAEDVNDVAPTFFDQREEDLKRDAGPHEIDRLRARFDDVLNFCIQKRRINVFLVEARYLREEEWGRDIAALADLRFVHRVGNVTVKSSRPEFTGHRFVIFALDLSSYAGSRITQITQVEFWTPDGKQATRAARCVYTPSGAATATQGNSPSGEDPTAIPGMNSDEVQLTFEAFAD
jgi:hypothetical protein